MLLTCRKCKKEKEENEFPVQKDKRFGRGSWCYLCKRKVEQERYARRSEKL